MKWENQDIVRKKSTRADELARYDQAKKKAWEQLYERLLNVEFPSRRAELSVVENLIQGPAIPISKYMYCKPSTRWRS